LTHQLRQFRAVLFVPKNHEAYHSTWPETLAILRDFESATREDPSTGDFVLLDCAIFRLPDTNVVILGCSLFSLVPPEDQTDVGHILNDFQYPDDWDVEAHNAAHKRDLEWLNTQISEAEWAKEDVRIMILTHWSPSRDTRATEARHRGSPITSAFSSDLSGERCFRSGKVKVWAFGHPHYNLDFGVARGAAAGVLRLVANQRGSYFAPAAGFDGEKVVEL